MYRERASRRVAGAMAWTRTVCGAGAEHRIVPDGCMDLIWQSGTLMVAGPDTRAQVAVSPPHAAYAALRFPPGLAPAVLDTWRYLKPESRWAAWTSRAMKVGAVLMVVKAASR